MQNYHKHSSWSNIFVPDSSTSYEDYAKRAVELGHGILSSVEHGWQGYYYQVYELAQKYNLKFVFGAEAYWVKDRLKEYPETLADGSLARNKDGEVKYRRDNSNCHIILLAKNERGRRAINSILSTANEDGYYFKPRVDLPLLMSLPADDVVVTTACFEKGMQVLTDNGYKNIESVKCNDKVLTHEGTWERVISPTSRIYKGKMYDLKVEGCFQHIKCTEDHEFPTVTKKHGYLTKEIVWKKAKDLVNTDRILDAVNVEYDDLDFIDVNDIIGDYREHGNLHRRNKSPIITDRIQIDDLFLQVLGLYVAEGSTNKNSNYLVFSLHKKETHLFDVINEFSNRYLNKDAVIHYKKVSQGMDVVVHSKEMTLLFTHFIHSGCENKNVPTFVKKLKPSLQMSFIKGLFLGDGSSTEIDRVSFSTVSPQLAYDVVDILERNNIKCGCIRYGSRIDKNGVKHRPAYIIQIFSPEFRTYWEVFKNTKSEYDFSLTTSFSSQKPIEINGVKYFAKRIRHKSVYDYDGMVYCLNVDNTHSFKLEGISVHNCIAYWKYEDIEDITVQMHEHFGSNFYLEIQYHDTDKQREISKRTLELSRKYNIPMIVGLDSHYITSDQIQEREYILEAKGVKYEDEEGWFMDYPDDQTVVERFLKQGIFSLEDIRTAMDNTNITLTFEDYSIDNPVFSKDVKLPSLYPDETQAQRNKRYSVLISKLFTEYAKANNITGDEYKRYFDGIKTEVQTVKDTGMSDYFLLDYQIVKEALASGGILTDTGRGCFTSDAMALTLNGIKHINEVAIGDYVIDQNGTPQKVINTMQYDCHEEMLQILYAYGPNTHNPLICTKDHKILIHRNNDNLWVEAQDIQKGDYVCVPKIHFEDKAPEYIDLNDYNIFGYDFDDEYIYEYRHAANGNVKFNSMDVAKHIGCSKAWVLQAVNNPNKTKFRKPEYVEKLLEYTGFKSLQEYSDYLKNAHTIKVNRFIKNDELFNTWVGMMYGDGWVQGDSWHTAIGLAVSTYGHKQHVNKTICLEMAKRFNVPYQCRVHKTKQLEQILFKSTIINEFAKRYLFTSKKGKQKQFNQELFYQSQQNLQALLRGLTITDGSVGKEKHRDSFDNVSTSIIGAYKILVSATSENVTSLAVRNEHIDDRGYNAHTSYKLRIMNNTENNLKISYRTKSDDKYIYLPVLNVKPVAATERKVYDITVENSHSYVLDSIVVHNSSVGYFTNTLLGFSKVDRFQSPITLYPERFISKTRILETHSLPD